MNEQGNGLVKQMKMLQKKIQQFNQKYLAQVAESQKQESMISFIKKKLKKEKSQVISDENNSLSKE